MQRHAGAEGAARALRGDDLIRRKVRKVLVLVLVLVPVPVLILVLVLVLV